MCGTHFKVKHPASCNIRWSSRVLSQTSSIFKRVRCWSQRNQRDLYFLVSLLVARILCFFICRTSYNISRRQIQVRVGAILIFLSWRIFLTKSVNAFTIHNQTKFYNVAVQCSCFIFEKSRGSTVGCRDWRLLVVFFNTFRHILGL
jgi:hypothetical protein